MMEPWQEADRYNEMRDMREQYLEQLEYEHAEEVFAEYGAYPEDTCGCCTRCETEWCDGVLWFRCRDEDGFYEYIDEDMLVVEDMHCRRFERKED